MTARTGRSVRAMRGFTIVELLIVLAIIIVLLSLLVVAVNIATRTAQKTRTTFLMNSIQQSLVQFREDVGYLPPVLNDGFNDPNGVMRDLHWPYDINATQQEVQDWSSMSTLAEYLIGYGDHDTDGYGWVRSQGGANDWDSEKPPNGIRDPGPDGVWGATAGAGGEFANRMANSGNEVSPRQIDRGNVFGPYLQLDDDSMIGAIKPGDVDPITGGPRVYFPGDAGYPTQQELDDGEAALAICDYWGRPIEYFRRPYSLASIKHELAGIDSDNDGVIDLEAPNLGDVIALRPWELSSAGGGDAEAQLLNSRWQDMNNDPSTSLALQTAQFALLSSGPDTFLDRTTRFDGDTDGDGDDRLGENEDNIVVTGQ